MPALENGRRKLSAFLAAVSLPIVLQPALTHAQRAENSAIEEVIITGEDVTPKTEIDPETELLLNVAGAGFDPLAALLSLPGVTFASDYSSEPAVRGSAPDDNGYYVDGVPARYVFHIFGHSIFNHNLIHSFDLYPAAFSSQYSNATGAIIDVQLREPRNQPYSTTVDASFLGTGVLLESGVSDNQAVYFSYRRSLLDIFITDEEDIEDPDSGVEVEQVPISDDYQFKYLWDAGNQHRFSFLAMGASDEVGATFQNDSNLALRDPDLAGPADVETRFDSQGITWDWNSTSENTSLSTVLTHITDRDDISYGVGQFLNIETDRILLGLEAKQKVGTQHTVIIGARQENTEFSIDMRAKIPSCSDFDPDCPTIDAPLIEYDDVFDMDTSFLYLEDVWQFSESSALRVGLHEMNDNFLEDRALDARARLDIQLGDNWHTHIAFGEYAQVPNPEEISPATGNPKLDYIESTHSVVGLKQSLPHEWSWQIELYHKKMENLPLSLSPLSDLDFLDRYSNDAEGEASGVELLIEKKLTDKFYGWLALSVSETERTNLRTAETGKFAYDKPIIFNLVGNYKLSENWLFGIKWSIQSGSLITPIVDVRPNPSNPTVLEPVYGELNSERLSPYHRLDFRMEYNRPTRYGYWNIFLDVLNAYNAKNIQGYRFAPNNVDTIDSVPDGFGDNVPLVRVEGLGWFPSVGFKIQF
ncbi:TonB-dependent receptor plug domain-containing protein [Aurantivibrio plasticivorans]